MTEKDDEKKNASRRKRMRENDRSSVRKERRWRKLP